MKTHVRNTAIVPFCALLVGFCVLWSPRAHAAPFTFMQPGFTQEVFAVAPTFLGGLAFAPDGDVWADQCFGGGSPLFRFDLQSTVIVNGTTIHPAVAGSPFASDAGCGLTNHPDGTLYSNTGSGVTNLDASTAASLRPAFGPGGDALGIAPHPATGELVYVGADGTIYAVDTAFTTSRVFSTVTTGDFVDGIFFDPSGAFLFASNRLPTSQLTILDGTTGNLVQNVPMTSEPDGIGFRATSPKFVVTSNTDGTMTRFDFPGDDFTLPPVQSIFASGGFRGDLAQVGADGCLYITQDGTRYDDGTTDGNNSVVRICGGFKPPAGVEDCTNGIDDDGDGLVDCADPNCFLDPACQPIGATPTTTTTSTPPVPTPTRTPPAAVCGDGVVNQPTEQCDGGDDDACPGQCQPSCLCAVNHFQCYEVHHADKPITGVTLDDQFGPSTVNIRRPKRICNPADKNHEDPSAPGDSTHLAGYTIKQTTRFHPIHDQVVVNQFGTIHVDVLRPDMLLVPSAKSRTMPPAPLSPVFVDHFKCYRVAGARFRTSGVNVNDEFGTLNLQILRPFRLCVPASKNGGAILNPVTHLMCYKTRRPLAPLPAPGTVLIDNQFGPDTFDVFRPTEFCVPSLKNPPATTPTPLQTPTPTPTATGCPQGDIVCGGTCVDPNTDPNNCGGCGIACPPPNSCATGMCVPPAIGGACLPTSSLSVLIQGKCTGGPNIGASCIVNSQCPGSACGSADVSAYVPNGSWSESNLNVQLVPLEGGVSRATIPTTGPVNSCSSNSLTGETVCTGNLNEVHLITGSTLNMTLTAGSDGTFQGFSGGGCQTCGVAINSGNNTAVLTIGFAGAGAYQTLDLGANTFAAPIPAGGPTSEDISVDPARHLVLSPNEPSNYQLLDTLTNGLFNNAVTPLQVLDSAAEDCTTGIALATSEGTGNLFIADLTQATFVPGSPGSWSAPSQIQNFPEFASLSAGTSGMAVAPGSHLAIVTGEFGGNLFGAVELPSTSGSGTPAVVDWVVANVPNQPDASPFNLGLDPHTVTAYTSPNSGKAFGVMADDFPRAYLAVVDLQALLAAPRTGLHTVDPSFDLVANNVLTFVSIF